MLGLKLIHVSKGGRGMPLVGILEKNDHVKRGSTVNFVYLEIVLSL